jgi:shikimate 5-dehydrogenase
VENRALAIDAAQKVFGEIKLLNREKESAQELAFVTPVATERELLTRLETLHAIEPLSVIRISDY